MSFALADEELLSRAREIALVDLDALSLGDVDGEIMDAFVSDVRSVLTEIAGRVTAIETALGGGPSVTALMEEQSALRLSERAGEARRKAQGLLDQRALAQVTLSRLSAAASLMIGRLWEADARLAR